METVARDYHVSPTEIAFVNQLEPGDDLSSTDSLVIPVPPAPSGKSRLTLYRVEHGDTLVTVADRFNITVQQLRRWNHLTAAKLCRAAACMWLNPRWSPVPSIGQVRPRSMALAQKPVRPHSTPAPKPTHTTANNSSSSTSHASTESVSLNR